jgi:hypothetical protein
MELKFNRNETVSFRQLKFYKSIKYFHYTKLKPVFINIILFRDRIQRFCKNVFRYILFNNLFLLHFRGHRSRSRVVMRLLAAVAPALQLWRKSWLLKKHLIKLPTVTIWGVSLPFKTHIYRPYNDGQAERKNLRGANRIPILQNQWQTPLHLSFLLAVQKICDIFRSHRRYV